MAVKRGRQHGIFARSPFSGHLGDDLPKMTPPPAGATDAELDREILSALQSRTDALSARSDKILKALEEQEKSRKWTLIIGAASALFAAVKLGLVAFPALKQRYGRDED